LSDKAAAIIVGCGIRGYGKDVAEPRNLSDPIDGIFIDYAVDFIATSPKFTKSLTV